MAFDLNLLKEQAQIAAKSLQDAITCMAAPYELNLREYDKDLGITFVRDHNNVDEFALVIQLIYPFWTKNEITMQQEKQVGVSNLATVKMPLSASNEEIVVAVKQRLNQLFTDPRDMLGQALVTLANTPKPKAGKSKFDI